MERIIQKAEREGLFIRQMALLNTLMETGAITREQYEFSANGLRTKMGMDEKTDEVRAK